VAGNSYGSLNAFGGGGSGSGPALGLNYADSSSLGGFYVLYDELAEQVERVSEGRTHCRLSLIIPLLT